MLRLTEAARLMDPLPVIRKNYRVNQPVLHLFFSRVYLHMGNLEGCVKEATKMIDLGSVLHDMTVSDMYPFRYENSDEVEMMFGSSPQIVQGPYTPNNTDLFPLFDQENDMRFEYGFYIPWNYPLTAPIVQKYEGSLSFAQAFRTAEAYLNRAEANALLGNIAQAMNDLNKLRRHRIVGYEDESITNKDALVEAIRLERRKEFCFENFRWFDLRRYGMPSIKHRYQAEAGGPIYVYTLKEKDPMYTLPIPRTVITRNTALSQNPSATMGERAPGE